MSPQRVGAVMRKEVREFRRNRFVISTMGVMPIVFLITPMITLFRIPDSATGTQVRAAVGVMSLLLLIVPIAIPPVIAAYSVVGERDQGTLEPVLSAPVRASELLLGKAAAAFVPSVGISYVVYFVAATSIRFGGTRRSCSRRSSSRRSSPPGRSGSASGSPRGRATSGSHSSSPRSQGCRCSASPR
jgi:ABC-type transport system involved in multi-copper enzyme maturation permease subunit